MSSRSSASVKRAPKARGHLEGWQLGVLTLFIAWGSALVMVPRPVEPGDLPLPRIEPERARSIRDGDRALARAVEARPLDAVVRKLGSAMRAVGRGEAVNDPKMADLRANAEDAALAALKLSPNDVLELRAFQTEAFLSALARFEASGVADADLVELGGAFLTVMQSNGWIDREHGRVLMDDLALRASFKKRWNEIAKLHGSAFDLSLDESRALYAFFLVYPPAPPGAATSQTPLDTYMNQITLAKIDDLAKLDPDYPAEYAKGIVLYRLGSYPNAIDAFERYLAASPSGPYAVRAVNYMKASLEHEAAFGGP